MKKFFSSALFVLVFSGYSLYHYISAVEPFNYTAAPSAPTAPSLDSGTIAQVGSPQPAPADTKPSAPQSAPPPPIPKPAPTPVPTPAPAPKPKGQYIDGRYIGVAADAYYGNVQVAVTISGGKLADVQFLQYPSDRSTSRYINAQAMPILKSEAIAAQSAKVDGVSGASDTSAAFQESLASALARAKS